MRFVGSRTWPFALLYAIALALLVEGAGYLIVRGYDNDLGNRSQRHLYSAIRGHELNPDYRRDFDTGGRLIHSPQGFRRDGLIEQAKPEGTFRIFVLGGSALYGIGVQGGDEYPAHPSLANDETITFFLERELNRRARAAGFDVDVEVINAGVTAYQTFQHVLYFYETLYEYQPDMLLFLDGHNDFYNVDPANPIKAYGYSAASMVRAVNERRPLLTMHVASRYLGQYSYAFKFLEQVSLQLHERYEAPPHNSSQSARLPDGDFGTALETAAAIGFLRNYRLIDHFAREAGIDYHVFLQPEVVFENDQRLHPQDRAIKTTTEQLYGPERVELMQRARGRFPALFAGRGIPYTDLGAVAAGAGAQAQLYLDYCHLTPQGAQAVAERMLPVVMAKMLERLRREQEVPAPTAVGPV
jgi:lysophospholipase L1-like esterase